MALYASHLLRDNFVIETLDLYKTHGTPAMPQNFNIYKKMVSDILALPGTSGPDSFELWQDLRHVLLDLVSLKLCCGTIRIAGSVLQNQQLAVIGDVSMENKMYFQTLLLIAHYFAARAACLQVPSLKYIAVKISVSLLRYTDIIPADRAYYEAGE